MRTDPRLVKQDATKSAPQRKLTPDEIKALNEKLRFQAALFASPTIGEKYKKEEKPNTTSPRIYTYDEKTKKMVETSNPNFKGHGIEIADPLFDVATMGIGKALTSGFRFATKPNMYYRTIGREGLDDALKTGVLRANPKGDLTALARPSDVPYFAKGQIGKYPGKDVIAEVGGTLYKKGDINPVTQQVIRSRHGGYKRIGPDGKAVDVPIEDVKFYEKSFLRGYKEINVKTKFSQSKQKN